MLPTYSDLLAQIADVMNSSSRSGETSERIECEDTKSLCAVMPTCASISEAVLPR